MRQNPERQRPAAALEDICSTLFGYKHLLLSVLHAMSLRLGLCNFHTLHRAAALRVHEASSARTRTHPYRISQSTFSRKCSFAFYTSTAIIPLESSQSASASAVGHLASFRLQSTSSHIPAGGEHCLQVQLRCHTYLSTSLCSLMVNERPPKHNLGLPHTCQ